jgi:uncharacterized linocin/CFP29 family protein
MDRALVSEGLDGLKGTPGGGTVALKLLQSGFSINALRDNTVLRKDEWLALDKTVIEVARMRLVAVGDLMSRGLRYPLPNALGKTVLEWELIGDMTDAEVSMSGVTEGQSDRVEFDLTGIPLPIIHKDFNINIRALHASRNGSTPLDTTQAALSARIVAEKIEQILFDGYALKHGGYTIKGYTNATNRNTGQLTGDWATTGVDGSEILSDVIEMIGKARADHFYGPYVLYVPTDYYLKLGEDYKLESDKTIMSRLREVPGIADIKDAEWLTGGGAGEVLLVQLTRDVVDMVDGMQPTTVMWESHGGFVFNFKVMAIMVPRMKSDMGTQCGIVHYTVA